MFILRRFTSEKEEINHLLGETYNYVNRDNSPDQFQKVLNTYQGNDKKEDPEIMGFISHHYGSQLIPLYRKSRYYVMVSDGNTFAGITFN